ncbi:hypothetical protein TNCV_1333331 [Trichonephila clavipes]|nr:hypothetical protein TNCV_1333331 [Trichonephila clavipes]
MDHNDWLWLLNRSQHCRVMVRVLLALKPRRVRRLMHVKSVDAQTCSRGCGVEVRIGECQLRCRPHHLNEVKKSGLSLKAPSLIRSLTRYLKIQIISN